MTNRRSFLTALGAGYAMANNTWAQSQRAARAAGARNTELFFTAETAYGKVQGMVNTGIKEFKGHPVRSAHRRQEPLHAAQEAGGMDRRPRVPGVRADFAANRCSSLASDYAPVDRVGPAHRPAAWARMS